MKSNKIFKNSIMAFICIIVALMPSFQGYTNEKSMYMDKSDTLILNAKAIESSDEMFDKNAAWPAIIAGIALGIVAVVGMVDGWNSIGDNTIITINDVDYDKMDFSNFDNKF